MTSFFFFVVSRDGLLENVTISGVKGIIKSGEFIK